ncbi:MAG: histidine triad nucleotide-binding protein [Candidatus Moranbacteria bacterium CG23_combo_of_CG06-09_8_20_14_all_39_10]|nr:MAG: histidine triad nucleotide-binding protein [Candidatus Moranbacteria bacterium CG23_combo_of_CG06-09_8_20_14_all_39_10]
MSDCLFCKIAQKEIPAEIVFEDDEILAFKDIHPLAPTHILIIPKRHIATINDLAEGDVELMGRMIVAGKKIAAQLQISEKGYKLLFRVGEWGGQEIAHIHLHLIGGAKLYEDIRPI